MKTTTQLRNLLRGDRMVVAAGAYDGVSARVVEEAGFPAVYITGFGLEASVLGSPDMGLLSFSEILDRASKISAAVNVPTILDGETGFGGPIQVARAIKEFEKAGVAAIHIEDQLMPKKCGSMATKMLIPVPEAVAKIKAAVDARTDPDFIIIARSDADVISIEEVIERCQRYLEAGADMAFPVFVQLVQNSTPTQAAGLYRRVASEIGGPCLFCHAGWKPEVTASEIQAVGYKIAIYPVFTLFAATKAMREAVNELKTKGTPEGYFKRNPGLWSIPEFFEFIGLKKILEMEKKYGTK